MLEKQEEDVQAERTERHACVHIESPQLSASMLSDLVHDVNYGGVEQDEVRTQTRWSSSTLHMCATDVAGSGLREGEA